MKNIWCFLKRNKILLFQITLFFFYGFNNTLSLGLYGIIIWIQADCLSITNNYFTKGPSFWESETHNYISDEKNKGAKYIIATNPKHLEDDKLKPFIKDKIGQFKKASIFKL